MPSSCWMTFYLFPTPPHLPPPPAYYLPAILHPVPAPGPFPHSQLPPPPPHAFPLILVLIDSLCCTGGAHLLRALHSATHCLPFTSVMPSTTILLYHHCALCCMLPLLLYCGIVAPCSAHAHAQHTTRVRGARRVPCLPQPTTSPRCCLYTCVSHCLPTTCHLSPPPFGILGQEVVMRGILPSPVGPGGWTDFWFGRDELLLLLYTRQLCGEQQFMLEEGQTCCEVEQ